VTTLTLSTRRLLLPVVIGAIALSLSGCSSLFSSPEEPVRDETGQIAESNDSTDVFALTVGDCTNDEGTTSGEISTVAAVPCDEPHDNEAYLSVDLPEGEYPGDDSVATQADTICYDAFPTFVGIAYEESRLDYFPITPTEESWTGGADREVLCMVYDANAEKLTGTAAGLGE
jgi:hypothetical protein